MRKKRFFIIILITIILAISINNIVLAVPADQWFDEKSEETQTTGDESLVEIEPSTLRVGTQVKVIVNETHLYQYDDTKPTSAAAYEEKMNLLKDKNGNFVKMHKGDVFSTVLANERAGVSNQGCIRTAGGKTYVRVSTSYGEHYILCEHLQEIKKNQNPIFYQPDRVTTGTSSEENLDDVITDAKDFIQSGEAGGIGTVDQTNLQKFSGTLYNILLSIGVAVAVIVGAILGIKLMISGVEEKAEIKGLIIPYVVGCIIVFGSFTIWKIVVELLSGI